MAKNDNTVQGRRNFLKAASGMAMALVAARDAAGQNARARRARSAASGAVGRISRIY